LRENSDGKALHLPERSGAQQKTLAHVTDRAVHADLDHAIPAGEHDQRSAQIFRTGIKQPLTADFFEWQVGDPGVSRSQPNHKHRHDEDER
jgi:hypothetical protein